MMDLPFTALRTRLAAPARPRGRALPWRPLAAALAVLLLLAGGWAWVRQSSFVAAKEVRVTGLTTSEAAQVEEALRAAGAGMSTLAPREDVLRAAVQPFATVAGIEVRGDFPRTLRVHVRERRPVALLAVGESTIPVAADGRLLGEVEPDGRLPLVSARALTGERLADRTALDAVSVIAAAPADLHDRVHAAERDDRGLVLDLYGGPDLIFGDTTRPRAKWAAAARVLAEPSAAGAVYLDLRVPERVAAGGLGPVDPATADTTGAEAPQPGASTLDSQVEVETPDAAMPLAQVQPD